MTESVSSRRRPRATFWFCVKIGVASAALAWVLTRTPIDDLVNAVRTIHPVAFGLALALSLGSVYVGATRWLILLRAYGVTSLPSLHFLARVYLVCIFYNTFLPGSVGGDLLRGHVTRTMMAGKLGGYLVVFVERAFGLAGLLLLAASILLVHPIGDTIDLRLVGALGTGAALLAALLPLYGRALLSRLPGRLGTLGKNFPVVIKPTSLLPVLGLSLCTQASVAIGGYFLVASVDPAVTLLDSLAILPIALASAYFPATVAGLGVREMAFVTLFQVVGVSPANATAASLGFLCTQLTIAALGGVLHLFSPVARENA